MRNGRYNSVRSARPGFSILELLVVAGILVLLLGLAALGLRGLIGSSERSLAENQLRVALTGARDAAIRTDGGDAAAVFFFENGKTTVIACERVGVLVDDERIGENNDEQGFRADREVFVPVPNVEPVTLPAGWTVRGFAPPGSIHFAGDDSRFHGWYDSTGSIPDGVELPGAWVFPETSFLDPDDATGEEGWKRQTFAVRFEGQTGRLATGDARPFLVVSPSGNEEYHEVEPFGTYHLHDADNTGQFVRRLLANRNIHLNADSETTDLHRLIGSRSSDTVLCRPVMELALADEAVLARGVGARRLNPATRSLYAAEPTPTIDLALFPNGTDLQGVVTLVNTWITGNINGTQTPGVAPFEPYEARIFTLTRSLGQAQEILP